MFFKYTKKTSYMKKRRYIKRNIIQKYNYILKIIVLILFNCFLFYYLFSISPRESHIYYDGTVESANLHVNSDKLLDFDIIFDNYNSEIDFYCPPENTMMMINNDSLQSAYIDNISLDNYNTEKVFPFIDGTANLRTNGYFHLSLEMPNDKPFSYDIKIVNRNSGSGKKNLITIDNFPKDLIITLLSKNEIQMLGNISDTKMTAAKYRVVGCNSISFYMQDSTYGNSIIQYDIGMSKIVVAFEILNNNKSTLEFTLTSKTEFKELGHIEISGQAINELLTVEIENLGVYPLPVIISGRVGEIKIGGISCYLDRNQWLTENMNQLILASFGIVFTLLATRPSSSN